MNEYLQSLIVFLAFGIYGFIHSFLASNRVKMFIRKFGTGLIAFYRFIYNVFAFYLFVIMVKVIPRPATLLYELKPPFDLIFFGISALSFILFVLSFRYVNVGEFFGIYQIIAWFKGEFKETDEDEHYTLRKDGFYRFTKHPMYLFASIAIVFIPTQTLFSAALSLSILIYFYIGSKYEEKKLTSRFGDNYVSKKK